MSRGKLQIFNFKNLLSGISKICNVPEAEILATISLPEAELIDNNGYIDADYGIALWNFGLNKNDYIGLEVAKRSNPIVGGQYLLMLITQYPDYEQAAINLCKFSKFMGNTIDWEYVNGAVTFDAIWKDEHPQIFRGAIEMNIITVFLMARQISHGKLTATKIEVSYSNKKRQYSHLHDLEERYRKAFEFEDSKCPVLFNQKRNAVVFSLNDLRTENPFSENPGSIRVIESKLKEKINNTEENGIIIRCKEIIKRVLYSDNGRKLSFTQIAEKFNKQDHELRKELSSANTSYLGILNEIRLEIYNELKGRELEKPIYSQLGFTGKNAKTSFAHWKKRNIDKVRHV